jgi:hypothetical protein
VTPEAVLLVAIPAILALTGVSVTLWIRERRSRLDRLRDREHSLRHAIEHSYFALRRLIAARRLLPATSRLEVEQLVREFVWRLSRLDRKTAKVVRAALDPSLRKMADSGSRKAVADAAARAASVVAMVEAWRMGDIDRREVRQLRPELPVPSHPGLEERSVLARVARTNWT